MVKNLKVCIETFPVAFSKPNGIRLNPSWVVSDFQSLSLLSIFIWPFQSLSSKAKDTEHMPRVSIHASILGMSKSPGALLRRASHLQ